MKERQEEEVGVKKAEGIKNVWERRKNKEKGRNKRLSFREKM